MKDLTTENQEALLGKIKSFLNISWNDEETDDKLNDFIISSIIRLDDIAGTELDYINDVRDYGDKLYQSMCYLGRELLKNRVFYSNEKGLDDFEDNYRSEVTSLFLMGKAYKNRG